MKYFIFGLLVIQYSFTYATGDERAKAPVRMSYNGNLQGVAIETTRLSCDEYAKKNSLKKVHDPELDGTWGYYGTRCEDGRIEDSSMEFQRLLPMNIEGGEVVLSALYGFMFSNHKIPALATEEGFRTCMGDVIAGSPYGPGVYGSSPPSKAYLLNYRRQTTNGSDEIVPIETFGTCESGRKGEIVYRKSPIM